MADRTDEEIAYWKDTAEHDWDTVMALFKSTRYDACLFFSHLAIEKALKGLVVAKTREPAPYTHNLTHLAETAGLVISKERKAHLEDIATFNIAGRYDNIKRAFYKKCTKDYTEENLAKAKELFVWLQEKYQEK